LVKLFLFDATTTIATHADFLVVTRGIFEPCGNGEDLWNTQSVSEIPLESDSRAVEYLSQYDYDVDKALFHLYSELGFGKGVSLLYFDALLSYLDAISCHRILTRIKLKYSETVSFLSLDFLKVTWIMENIMY
jgi:hypothetical protein